MIGTTSWKETDPNNERHVVLSCPCGAPLELIKHEGRWLIGHMYCHPLQSPLVFSKDPTALLEKFFGVKRSGEFDSYVKNRQKGDDMMTMNGLPYKD